MIDQESTVLGEQTDPLAGEQAMPQALRAGPDDLCRESCTNQGQGCAAVSVRGVPWAHAAQCVP